jgi:hypothetical protein
MFRLTMLRRVHCRDRQSRITIHYPAIVAILTVSLFGFCIGFTAQGRDVAKKFGWHRRSPHSADAGSLFYRMGASIDQRLRALYNKRTTSQRTDSAAAAGPESIFMVPRFVAQTRG